ncbi:acetyl-coenzyme A carboxylase carboxyl transferase subunit alpha, chloroplastic-like [Nymphaea colorata]|nr:acetyl-coenzyme A carboxylase carboxyl transferase subunit alpha, chloroplastic-like [Nymphaea colorata]
MSSLPHFPATSSGRPASDLLRSSFTDGMPLKTLGRASFWIRPRRLELGVLCMKKMRKVKKHDYPWPDPKDVDPDVKRGFTTYLSDFKPLAEKPKPVPLPFEKPLMDLEMKITDVKKMAEETGLDFTDQISLLENKYQQALKDLYTRLTPIQRLSIARHPNRPTFLDHVLNITDKWVELHGDRAGYDDPAIVTGLGSIDGKNYMFIGHQKGRNTKENIHRNFAMPTPHGYRKALRMMYYADHHGFPIITFIDTPGAFADLKSEEIGQGEAIAHNLRTMFGLKVPIVTVVIGEGGSGGALAIGCANKLLMMENSVFYVASPEACAAILWKSAQAAPKAAEKLRITASELCKLKIADGIIPEPLGGAHVDPSWTSQQIKVAIIDAMNELSEMDTEALLNHRMLKFRAIGGFEEATSLDPRKKINMKKKDEPTTGATAELLTGAEIEGEIEKLKEQLLKSKESSDKLPDVAFNEMIDKLRKEVELEYTEAVTAVGLQERLDMLRQEVAKARTSSEQPLDPVLEDKINKVKQEFSQRLAEAPNLAILNSKLQMLKDLTDAKKQSEKNSRLVTLKEEINKGLQGALDQSKLKEELVVLREEISRAGVTNVEDLDEGLKEKIVNVREEIVSNLGEALKSMNLNIEHVVPKEVAHVEDYVEQQRYAALKDQITELNEEISKEIVETINSSDLKGKIENLKLEASMSGKSSNPEVKSKLEELKQEIKQRVEEAMSSSELAEKYEMLMQEMVNIKSQGVSLVDEEENSEGGESKHGFSGMGIINMDADHNRSLI